MTDKEKVIAGAYNGLTGYDENGWAVYHIDKNIEAGIEPFGEYETKDHISGSYLWRPISLQGIENNNSWIKIESEDDLPKEIINCWVKTIKNGIINTVVLYNCYGKVFTDGIINQKWSEFTHYQPIIKPSSPIY